MKIVRALMVVLIAGASMTAAQEQPAVNPQTKTPVITKRQANQRARIRQGVKSGELTKGEAAKLRRQQRHIQADKKAAKSDGVVTAAERRHLKREENRASRNIYRKKHNERERPKAN